MIDTFTYIGWLIYADYLEEQGSLIADVVRYKRPQVNVGWKRFQSRTRTKSQKRILTRSWTRARAQALIRPRVRTQSPFRTQTESWTQSYSWVLVGSRTEPCEYL